MTDAEKPSSSKRRATAAQAAAGRVNLAKGHASRSRRSREAREAGAPRAKDKWAMLLSGQITVRDMDDEELKRIQFRNKSGDFSGKRRNLIPSSIASAIHQERMRRATSMLEEALPAAIKALTEIVTEGADGEIVKTADVRAAANIIIERNLGKPDSKVTVHVQEDPWAKITEEALVVDDDLSSLEDM